MENVPVITIGGTTVRPDDTEKYLKWHVGAYMPLHKQIEGLRGMNTYFSARNRPDYPSIITLLHYKDLKAREAFTQTQIMKDVQNDRVTTFRGTRFMWNHQYQLVRSYRNNPSFRKDNQDTRIENVPIMHLEAYRLTPEEADDYRAWLAKWGYEMYIPILMRLPGLKGYDLYEGTDSVQWRTWEEPECPSCLSILYFDSIESFDNYEKSPELVSMHRAINSDFPRAFVFEWYVQYQQYAGWRK